MLSNGKIHPETGKTDEIDGIKATRGDLHINGGKAPQDHPSRKDEYTMQIDVPVKSYMPVTYKVGMTSLFQRTSDNELPVPFMLPFANVFSTDSYFT